eukprot:gnl/TRDRNA2_/TRDRNA2_32469_c0_seq1.p1 gnl/TRDRNA2_/TRDRNA2_32469_c0~~gnl/TRDRNA2_/TRDRNA2_32469_c0_seq1.p1  ORF type:complete len:248 (-),score=35.14 gnl/TRDRNA2_/TRDRNA2_32469_c0_seq1:45-755(-)
MPNAPGSPPERLRSSRCRRLMGAAAVHSVASTSSGDDKAPRRGLLRTIDDATKWVVSGSVFATLVWRHDACVCWCVVGSVLAAANCKLLKRVINVARPVGARKADPGMPSSHAQSLSFLSTFFALELLASSAMAPVASAAAAMLVVCALFLTWLRVALGHHTVAQVLVGYLLGAASAAVWRYLFELAAISKEMGPKLLALYGLTAAAVALFAIEIVKNWIKELRRPKSGNAQPEAR